MKLSNSDSRLRLCLARHVSQVIIHFCIYKLPGGRVPFSSEIIKLLVVPQSKIFAQMFSRPRKLVLLIGAASAVPYPVSTNPMYETSEYYAQDLAINEVSAGHVRLAALPLSSTIDLAHMVTPVTPASPSSPYELTEITPVTEPTSSTTSESTGITPVSQSTSSSSLRFTESTSLPIPTSSPQITSTRNSALPAPVTVGESPTQPVPTSLSITTPAPAKNISTVTVTDWVTVTVDGARSSDPHATVPLAAGGPGPLGTQTWGSETAPMTITTGHRNSSASRRPELPGGFLGGPPLRSGEAQPKE